MRNPSWSFNDVVEVFIISELILAGFLQIGLLLEEANKEPLSSSYIFGSLDIVIILNEYFCNNKVVFEVRRIETN